MGFYDHQQVCLNGHQITDTFNSTPKERKSYCTECGASTISVCPICKNPIKGDYIADFPIPSEEPTPVPSHCEKCGTPFQWAKKNLKNNSDHSPFPNSKIKKLLNSYRNLNLRQKLGICGSIASIISVVLYFFPISTNKPLDKEMTKQSQSQEIPSPLQRSVKKNPTPFEKVEIDNSKVNTEVTNKLEHSDSNRTSHDNRNWEKEINSLKIIPQELVDKLQRGKGIKMCSIREYNSNSDTPSSYVKDELVLRLDDGKIAVIEELPYDSVKFIISYSNEQFKVPKLSAATSLFKVHMRSIYDKLLLSYGKALKQLLTDQKTEILKVDDEKFRVRKIPFMFTLKKSGNSEFLSYLKVEKNGEEVLFLDDTSIFSNTKLRGTEGLYRAVEKAYREKGNKSLKNRDDGA